MPRYIDAEAMLKFMEDRPYIFSGEWDASDFKDFIKEQPAVDAIPVVRCKNCKYFCKASCESIAYCSHPSGFITNCGENFFCASGRKVSDD